MFAAFHKESVNWQILINHGCTLGSFLLNGVKRIQNKTKIN